VTADDNLFERIAWPDIYKRLRALAGWLSRDQSRVFDAVSADDLVSETLLEFLSSPDGLGWTPGRGKLETFLCTVLRNKFIDHVRRHRHNAGPPDEFDLFVVRPEGQLEQQEVVDQVMLRVQGRTDLEETVAAICEGSGDAPLNQELAEDLGTTVPDVVNRKKRIRRACEKDSPRQLKPRKEPQIR
jgi:DNA-directed RNA polymerase specialized sigma24 family protein